MPRSPKGLIENRSVTPEEMPQLGSPDDLIAFWKWFAESHIEANPATDDTLDRTAAAVAVLDRLQVIEHSRAAAQRNPASGSLYAVGVYHGMLLASRVHQLAIIDNEKAIAAVPKAEGARVGAAVGRTHKTTKSQNGTRISEPPGRTDEQYRPDGGYRKSKRSEKESID